MQTQWVVTPGNKQQYSTKNANYKKNIIQEYTDVLVSKLGCGGSLWKNSGIVA